MKSFTPIDLERRSFTGLRCVFLVIMVLAVGGSLYTLVATAFNLWLAGLLLLPNSLLIYLSVFAKDNTLRNTHETLKMLGDTFG
ncbi:hypothetical protein F7R01_06765 [Pseudomonas argentinensis]|uniref:Uncharacterized protein n=1 Tax=Phytopseudomonas argentinensis TaxID=289370 RepID=A0A1I3JZI6_9GAMM|nr:hypothetical protein [Pseudomonas argentinensis]KAB0550897.1 hypothetical protein F7R01_06765 [Pseudomonas argentinensis]SFI65603.1 hypothetical protein SAMN05216602_2175 [Pseudomonas argentinensis]